VAELAHDHSACIVCRAKAQAPRRLLQAAALFAAGLCVTYGVLELRPAPTHTKAHPVAAAPAPAELSPQATPAKPKPAPKPPVVVRKPAAVSAAALDAASASLTKSAAAGVDRSFFLSSPGGIFATAARVAKWRPLVVRAAKHAGVRPNLLEAIVFVESSGRGDVTGGSAAGLAQLHPSVARRFGLHVDTRHGGKLTRRIAHTWRAGTVKQLRRWRARYDQRFAPARSLRAAAAYLASAQKTLGREDLAVEAYHIGVKPLRRVRVSYATVYVRSSRYDDYAFRVYAAERVMHTWRRHPSALRFEARQQAQKNSSEEYLHPRSITHRFSNPAAILHAEQHHKLRMIPLATPRTHIAISGTLGSQARSLGRSRRLYRALRPQALDVLLYIGERVHELSHVRAPLILTSAVRDDHYQRSLMRVNVNAARSYSLHTTGYAFDIARAYKNGRQARAFQFVLDRLSAVNAIAYIREAAAIHVAVASDAAHKLALLKKLG
jgi:soluble lytic murein transglycosylase-like protein